MKKLFAVTIIFALVLLAGCGKKAEPIEIPSSNGITGIEVTMYDGTIVDFSDGDRVDAVTDTIDSAKPTQQQSVNDQPTNVESYGTITFKTHHDPVTVYYYEKDGNFYLEQPYRGIYELSDDFEKSIIGE